MLIDDIYILNSYDTFRKISLVIYMSSLVLNKENIDNLYFNITITNGKFILNVYEKRDNFKF